MSKANSLKTHCKYGHPFNEVNTYVDRRGIRVCRMCSTARNARTTELLRKQRAALPPKPQREPFDRKTYAREWVAQRRAAYFDDKACVECGSNEQLELDHINPALKVANSIWSWSEQRRTEEIAKCQVLCTECHKAKTQRQRLEGVDTGHGTLWRYKTGKCRCVLCRLWNTNRVRRQRGLAPLGTTAAEPLPPV